jgi:hypothetical protein
MENPFLKQALHEFNMKQPATSRFYRYEELVASAQSRIDARAEQLEIEELDRLYTASVAEASE